MSEHRNSNNARVTTLRAALATASLLTPAAILLAPGEAHATCTIAGVGPLDNLQSGDDVNCVGTDTVQIAADGQSLVSVTIGDGATPTSVSNGANPLIVFNSVSDSAILVRSGATLDRPSGPIILNSSNSNTVAIEQGGTASADAFGAFAISLGDSSFNTISVSGSLEGGSSGAAVSITGASNENDIVIASTGSATSANDVAIFVGTSSGSVNTITNNGLIESGVGFAISANSSDGDEIVDNFGTITGLSNAISLDDGDDRLIARATSVINGTVDLGLGSDTLELHTGAVFSGAVDGSSGFDVIEFGGSANGSFDLADLDSNYLNFDALVLDAPAIWTLTGASTTFTGNIFAFGGTLVMNGDAVDSNVNVEGGTLMGAGTMGSLFANDGSIISPGNSIGTMTFTGSVNFDVGSTYLVEIAPDGASDLISATGAATLSGGTVDIVPIAATGYLANTQYTILTAAGGVTGAFAALAPLDAPLVSGVLTYDANNVYFLLQQIQGFDIVADTPNQQAVADAFDTIQTANSGSPDLTTAINTLAAQNTAAILAGLDDLAGQIHADGQHYVMDQGAGFHRFVASSARNLDDDRRLWAGLYRDDAGQDGEAGFFGHDGDSFGGAIGARLWQGENASAGAAIGYSSGEMGMDGQGDSLDADTLHLAFHGDAKLGGFELQGEASLGFASLSTSREIAFLNETASGEADAQLRGLSLDVAYPIEIDGGFTLSPFALVEYFGIDRDGFTETGAPGVNLVLGDDSTESVDVTLGARGDLRGEFATGHAWRIGGRLAARMASDSEAPSFTTSFQGDPSVNFSILGIERPDMIGLYGLDADIALGSSGALRFSYDAAFGDGYDSQALRASVNVGF